MSKSSNFPEDFRISITAYGRDYLLKTTQTLPIQREKAFAFFESPQNLFEITPDWLDFRIDAYQPEKKARRRKEIFPKDCEKAFKMGARFAECE